MFQNYFKIALRHISRNKGYVFINVIGLGIALACTMIAFVNNQAGVTADSFHENYPNLFRVIAHDMGNTRPTADISAPLVIRAATDLPGVKAGVRFSKPSVTIQYEDAVFGERLATADPNFLEVFTFPLIEGDKEALKDPSMVLISQKSAKKYFGDEPAMGKVFTVNPGQEGQQQLTVGGVFEDITAHNSSLTFNFLTHISFLESGVQPDTLTSWKERVTASFLLLEQPENSVALAQQLNQYIPLQNEAVPGDKRLKYLLQPMNEVFMKGNDVNNNFINRAGADSFYWGPWIMALLILLTACLNFTNTTISFSNKRLKEMGVRKVMGSGRTQLMFQLLGESLVICLLALAFGIIVAEYLTPLYNSLWSDMGLELSLDYFNNTDLVMFLGGLLLFVTFLGGAYPAFYISSFRPSHIFRGNAKFGGDNWLIRSLLGLQIVISLIAIIGGITFAENASFQEKFDFGYDVDGIINVSIKDAPTYEQFKNAISGNPDILGVAGARNNLGFGNWWSNVGKQEDNKHAQVQLVGEDFLKVMGLSLVEGRPFDKNLATDYDESVIVNQKFVKDQKWTTGLGQTVEMYGGTKNVIGVVEDFHPGNFFDRFSPNVFHFEKADRFRVMKVKVPAAKMIASKKYLEEKWTQSFPLVPFNGYFQDETLAETLSVSKNVAYIYLFLSIVCIFLAATGLFSLVSLNVLKRAKEIAVRRVLGASAENITYVINKHYLLVFGVGGIIGGLVGGWFAYFLIDEIFAVHQGVNTTSIILAVIGICLIGGLTIGGKLFGVLQTNPADTLKSE